jgi:hypothetical protein
MSYTETDYIDMVLWTDPIFHVYQSQEDGDSVLLFATYDGKIAQDVADRIDSNLSAAGIPSSVSSAYVVLMC